MTSEVYHLSDVQIIQQYRLLCVVRAFLIHVGRTDSDLLNMSAIPVLL